MSMSISIHFCGKSLYLEIEERDKAAWFEVVLESGENRLYAGFY